MVNISNVDEGDIKEKTLIKAAKEEELQKLQDFNAYYEVPDTGQIAISTR